MRVEFRGKREDNGEWIEGDLLYSHTSRPAILSEAVCYAVIPETVGQYVNKNDSEGRKMFVHDIVRFTYWWCDGHYNDTVLTGELVYMPECLSYGLRGVNNAEWLRHVGAKEGTEDAAPFAFWLFDEADFTVIGNRFDNPELKEEKLCQR